jgi:hypothetical protein
VPPIYCLADRYSLAVTQEFFSLSACLSISAADLTVFPLVLQIFFLSFFLYASVLQVSPAPLLFCRFAVPTASYAQLIPLLSILLILHPPVILSQSCLSCRLSCLFCIPNCLFVLQCCLSCLFRSLFFLQLSLSPHPFSLFLLSCSIFADAVVNLLKETAYPAAFPALTASKFSCFYASCVSWPIFAHLILSMLILVPILLILELILLILCLFCSSSSLSSSPCSLSCSL